jgi:hypothetical protein
VESEKDGEEEVEIDPDEDDVMGRKAASGALCENVKGERDNFSESVFGNALRE